MAQLQLENLPTELILQIFEELLPPLDIHAFTSASPVALASYTLNRHHILRPVIEDLETWLQPDNMSSEAMLACHFRMIPHDILHPDTSQIELGISSILKSPPPHPQVCQSNLGMLCELFRLRSEAKENTTSYATQAWSVPEGETANSIEKIGRFNPPFHHVSSVLSESELRRLEQGYLAFEIYRHFDYRDKTYPTLIKLNDSMKTYFPLWRYHDDSRRGMRGFQSIFRFLFVKYIGLVRRVYMRIHEQRVTRLASKDDHRENIDSPAIQDQCEATEDVQKLDLNRRGVSDVAKRHQELRCIASLCFRGFSLLDKLQRMDYTDREHFIVTTFQNFRSREQADGAEDRMRKVNIGFALERLCDPVNQDSWLGEHCFWDTDRIDELRFRRRRAEAQV